MPSAPADAPNILIVLLDDIGFGQSSTFGGPVNMPTLEKLAQRGLRYNRQDIPSLNHEVLTLKHKAQP